jgi:hypothetical protein
MPLALYSCTKPIPALRSTITNITEPSRKLSHRPSTVAIPYEASPATTSTSTRRSLNWERNMRTFDVPGPVTSSLAPYVSRRRAASSVESPSEAASSSRSASAAVIR